MNVPFFRYPNVYLDHADAYTRIIDEVGRRGAFIMQADLDTFEQRIATYTGAKYAVGVANATDGLQIGLMAADLPAGSEVIICSHTMIATAAAIHFAGLKPVPVDVAEDGLIDILAIDSAITSNTSAIMPTQLNGRTADMDAISDIANKNDVKVFEDAAQALGSRFKDQCAGTFGVASAISFYPAKTLGCLGDGGIVLTNDDSVYERLLLLRDHGRNAETGDIELWGMNTRLDNLQAAFLNHVFDTYDATIEKRRALAERYHDGLVDIEALVLPPPPSDGEHFDIFQNYEIRAQDRDSLKGHLANNNIGTLIQWGGIPVHQCKKLGFDIELPKTDQVFRELIMLPMNLSVTESEVDYICKTIRSFYDE